MVEKVVEEEMVEESNGRKATDLAAEWEENGWSHVESAGCHGGLLSEGHRQYMRQRKQLNEFFGLEMGTSWVPGNENPSFWYKLFHFFKLLKMHSNSEIC